MTPSLDGPLPMVVRGVCGVCALLHGIVTVCAFTALYVGYSGALEASVDPFSTYFRIVRTQDLAFLTAYVVDLVAVFFLDVSPFSRLPPEASKATRELATHHLPAMIACNVLGAPWIFSVPFADPALALLKGTDGVQVALLTLRSNGWVMISSFNEVLMCLQRVDWPQGLFNSRRAYCLEIGYKCLIFSMFSMMGAYNTTLTFYRLATSCAASEPAVLSAATCVAVCPVAWRIVAYTIFLLVMYPWMGRRARAKLWEVMTGRKHGTPPGAPHGYVRDLERRAKSSKAAADKPPEKKA